MMKLKNILAVVAISAATAILSVWGYGKLYQTNYAGVQDSGKLPVNYAGFFGNNGSAAAPVDFTTAAGTSTPAVVHIKTRTKAKQVANNQQRRSNPFGDLFGDDLIVKSLQGLKKKSIFIKAERGLQNEEGGLYPMPVLDAVLPSYPMLKLEFLADCNHYDMFLEASGAEKVAHIIYGDK